MSQSCSAKRSVFLRRVYTYWKETVSEEESLLSVKVLCAKRGCTHYCAYTAIHITAIKNL